MQHNKIHKFSIFANLNKVLNESSISYNFDEVWDRIYHYNDVETNPFSNGVEYFDEISKDNKTTYVSPKTNVSLLTVVEEGGYAYIVLKCTRNVYYQPSLTLSIEEAEYCLHYVLINGEIKKC